MRRHADASQEECRDLKAQISTLLGQPTTEKAGQAILLVETQIEDKNKKLALLQSGQKLVTPDQRERTERRYNTTQVRLTLCVYVCAGGRHSH